MDLTHSVKASGFNPDAYEVKTRFQSLLSNSSCTATARAQAAVLSLLGSVLENGGAVQLSNSGAP
jgi:hypothetical protein